MTDRFALTLTPDHRAASPYMELPFDVSSTAGSLEVRLTYDRGVVDLGCVGPAGFRGWSGGARHRFVIAPDAATPGYLPGETEPGTWFVLLGLHRIPDEGVDIVVEIDIPATGLAEPEPLAPPVPERPPRRVLPSTSGLSWLAGDFHAHTRHSDGALGRAGLASHAVSAGLDVLAVTDHNTISHHAGLGKIGAEYGVTLLRGQEMTTDRGHANAFGDIGWIDFRQPASEWVAEVASAGGLLSINHPLTADCAWHHRLDVRPPLAEIWHWSWLDRTWTAPLAWWTAWGLSTIPIGGSDFHRPDQGRPVGEPVTWVECESTEPSAVLDGMRAGRTAVSAARDAPVLLRVDDELVAVDADGLLLIDTDGRRQRVRGDVARFSGTPGPHRLETPGAEVIAITR